MSGEVFTFQPQRSKLSASARALSKYLNRLGPLTGTGKEALIAFSSRESVAKRLDELDLNWLIRSARDFARPYNGAKEAQLLFIGVEISSIELGEVQREAIPFWYGRLSEGRSAMEANRFLIDVLFRIISDTGAWSAMREFERVQALHEIWQMAYYKPSNRMQAAASP